MEEKLKTIFAHYNGKDYELIPILQEVQNEFGYLPEFEMSEVAKYMTCAHPTPMGNGTASLAGGVYVNSNAFSKLPADLQKILVETVRDMCA